MDAVDNEPLMTPKEVADLFRMSVRNVWRWVELGLLPRPAIRIGHTIRFRRSEILGVLTPESKRKSPEIEIADPWIYQTFASGKENYSGPNGLQNTE
jgi:excisionase family DNA binding protein